MVTRIHGDIAGDVFLREYAAENTPVVLTGALLGWGALSWNAQRIEELAGDRKVLVAPLPPSGRDKWLEHADEWGGPVEQLPGVVHGSRFLAVAAARVPVHVREFTSALQGNGNTYYADGNSNLGAGKAFEFLASDIGGPPSAGSRFIPKTTHLWLGGQTVSSLHFDNVENLFCQ
mmetsp:Transcript_24218/g.55298  ORF Transcript_24218/g.55298 Transcript_24218/m.55298 type:complete len:175 (+) Transcript_24218:10-534(+)